MENSQYDHTHRPGPLEGAMAGLIATAPMTVAMLLMRRLLPPRQRYPLEPSRITRRVASRLGLGRLIDDKEKQAAATA
ncbi:MAG TPA: hypothetical protein VM536_06730, partial [Chloroflexia bacterium]|nr:hypothetical protein [Chloroflexia bacterium]